MISTTPYDHQFFAHVDETSGPSAYAIAGWLCSIASPASVLDVGCGQGAWAASFLAQGVKEVVGVDGNYVDPGNLQIDSDSFIAIDLCKPFDLQRRFDLVVCLEVAEHLDADFSDGIVSSLAQHSDAVLFSAAVPNQRGTDHRNEQWPTYWIERFNQHAFLVHDVIRPQFWEDQRVAFWYRQNAILFTRDGSQYAATLDARCRSLRSFHGASLVHPDLWQGRIEASRTEVGDLVGPSKRLAGIGPATLRAIRQRLK